MSNVFSKNLGAVTAYGLALEDGYTGTKEEFAAGLHRSGEAADIAMEKAGEAAQSAADAATSEGNALASANNAAASANNAAASANNASANAGNALASANNAAASANNAASSAVDASASMASAAESERNAATSANNAAISESRAENSAAAAAASANIGKNSAIWAEGTDVQVGRIGGQHSCKGWAELINESYSGGLPVLLSTTPPTTSKVGIIGQFLVDTVAEKVYYCKAIHGTEQSPVYIWDGIENRKITTIPSDTVQYTLEDGGSYQHEPDEPPTYILPAANNDWSHQCVLTVKFTSTAMSCVFMRGSTVIPPRTLPTIVAGMVVRFTCHYEPLISQWIVESDQPSGRNVPPNNRVWYSAASKQQYSEYSGTAVNNFAEGYGEIVYGIDAMTSSGNILRGTAVTSVSLPDSVTTISQSGYEGCASLVAIRLPAGLQSVQLRGFYGCGSLALTELPASVYNIANWAFRDCTALALTALPQGVGVIHEYTFLNCVNLALSSLPSVLTEIQRHGFQGCTSLAVTEIPSGVTSIGAEAFSGCTGLTEVTFLGTPESISATAFKDCTNITSIRVPWASTDEINANAPWGATNATITYNYTGEGE